ncbi:MAG: UDP-N-acetylglucosamine 2-epimerase (non-hydrolyzing) [Flavobacteriaceae bacterium]|nr:UDP-N-acetylglucosamine 2-epimerase (non-hydrolyzing) [Flavobacteriaceae bacterium]
MTRNLIIFGTRPEAIKMAPLVKEFLKYSDQFDTRVCVTGQHREMLDQVLKFFEIQPEFDLDLMKPDQDLYNLTASIITSIKPILEVFVPDYVFIHGDTTTSMAVGVAAFYFGATVCHIEAGLRTYDLHSPFPEEMNRRVNSVISQVHFAPTEVAKKNLILENKNPSNIVVVGNTVIDALKFAVKKVKAPGYANSKINNLKKLIEKDKKMILVTVHRRESHGSGIIRLCKAFKEILEIDPGLQIIYPVHLNPEIQKPVYDLLNQTNNIQLISPVSYPAFVWLMEKSYLIITDSGGIQEEAPSLGKPVLVIRDKTERPEAIDSGTAILVGTQPEMILSEVKRIINKQEVYNKMANLKNPYGDGKASKKIVSHIMSII